MMYLRCLKLIWIIPLSWMDAIRLRKLPFVERYQRIQYWSKRLFKAFKIDLQVVGEEALPSDHPILFVSNHQSSFDLIMLVMGVPKPFTFVSKVQNQKIPYLNSWSKTLDLIYFDRDDQGSAIHMLRESARRLKAGKNLLIFPEGTRSRGKDMHPMMAGSLQPAFLSKAYIVPVVLHNSFDFKQIMKRRGTAKMTFLEPLAYEFYKPLKAEGTIALLQESMRKEINKNQDL